MLLLAIAFAAGIAAGDAELARVAIWQALCVKAAALGALARRPRARTACAVAVAFAAGALLLAERRAAAWWPSAEARVEAVVEARVAASALRGDQAVVDLSGVRRAVGAGEALPARVRVYVPLAGGSPLARAVPGDVVRAQVRLRPLLARFDPGTADPAERLRRAGIGGTGSLVHPALAWRAKRGVRLRFAAAFRSRRAAATRALEAQGAGLAAALALGARQGLPERDAEALRAAGLGHLLAVSGLNLAMTAGLAFALARRALLRIAPRAAADPRRAALGAAWAAAAGYAALTGFEVSVQRALAFLTVACAALWLRRPVSAGSIVALAALAVLAVEPAALFEPGAQLSFAAAAALLVALPAPRLGSPAPSRGERAAEWLRAALAISAAALAATAPIAALHFGRLAPGALLANVLAVPLTELVLLPLSLVAALLALAAPGCEALFAVPAAAVRIGGEGLTAIARLASAGPAAELAVAASPLAIALGAAAGAAALAVRGVGARVALVAVAHGALAALPPAPLLPAAPRVVALDVGQGDAVLVQGRSGALLVDAGPALRGGGDLGRTIVVPALSALGVRAPRRRRREPRGPRSPRRAGGDPRARAGRRALAPARRRGRSRVRAASPHSPASAGCACANAAPAIRRSAWGTSSSRRSGRRAARRPGSPTTTARWCCASRLARPACSSPATSRRAPRRCSSRARTSPRTC